MQQPQRNVRYIVPEDLDNASISDRIQKDLANRINDSFNIIVYKRQNEATVGGQTSFKGEKGNIRQEVVQRLTNKMDPQLAQNVKQQLSIANGDLNYDKYDDVYRNLSIAINMLENSV